MDYADLFDFLRQPGAFAPARRYFAGLPKVQDRLNLLTGPADAGGSAGTLAGHAGATAR
jgi:hypothetical protein